MRIKVIGIGCIGGSMALKLLDLGYDVEVYDVNGETLEMAKERGLIVSPDGAMSGDLNIIAVPMNVEEKILKEIKTDSLVMDVSSVMTPFIELANSKGLRFIGGHPMAGNERKGHEGWDEGMFEGRKFFLCEGKYTNSGDRRIVEKLVESLGSTPVWMGPLEHDRIVSKISQSIFFISLTAKMVGKDHEEFAGPGYISTTRLSKQNVEMVLDMVRYNGENIAEDLRKGVEFLGEILEIVESKNYEKLKERMMFQRGCENQSREENPR